MQWHIQDLTKGEAKGGGKLRHPLVYHVTAQQVTHGKFKPKGDNAPPKYATEMVQEILTGEKVTYISMSQDSITVWL